VGKFKFLEIVLQLGWGQPAEAAYKREWPASGSEYIHAVNLAIVPSANSESTSGSFA